MSQLKLGVMTTQEIAEWFGLKPKSYLNHRAEKLNQLKEYAEFTTEKGKINITKIIHPEYVKKSMNKNYTIVKDNFDNTWNPNGIDTSKWIIPDASKDDYADLFWMDFPKDGTQIHKLIWQGKVWCQKPFSSNIVAYPYLNIAYPCLL